MYWQHKLASEADSDSNSGFTCKVLTGDSDHFSLHYLDLYQSHFYCLELNSHSFTHTKNAHAHFTQHMFTKTLLLLWSYAHYSVIHVVLLTKKASGAPLTKYFLYFINPLLVHMTFNPLSYLLPLHVCKSRI